VISGGIAVSGTIYISDNYLSFAAEKKKKERLAVRDLIVVLCAVCCVLCDV
jgi:hypothetical protein